MSMLRMNSRSISALDRKLIASLRLAFETEAIISAAKIDEYKAKNPELADAIQTLNDELNRKKLQKHMAWGVKQLQAGEDVAAILEALDEFEALLKKRRGIGEVDPITRKRETEPFLKGSERDIFFYKKLKDLTEKISEAKQAVEERDVEEISKEEARKKIREEGVEYIYHDADFLVARPLTKKASCHYGMGTKWCISDPERDYFEQYSKDNRYFYFVIDRSKDAGGLAKPDPNKPDAKVNDPWAKVAFVFEKGNPDFLQAWNTPDIQMPLPRVLNHYTKEYGRKIYDLIHLMYKNVESLPNTWQYDVKTSNDPQRISEILKEHGDGNEDVRVAVAQNTNLPDDVQLTLAKDSSPEVRKALASAPRSSEVQELLSKDPEELVRIGLAYNVSLFDKSDETKASKAALTLASDSSAAVIKNLVGQVRYGSKKLPSEVMDLILQSPVAAEVAKSGYTIYNASTPQQLLRIIELNPSAAEDAAQRDIANDDVIEAALATGMVSQWRVNPLMQRLTITPERLEKMLADPTKSMANRINLAKSEKTTPEMLDRIADAGPMSTDLALALADNGKSSPALLAKLAALPDDGTVSRVVAENPNLTAEVATALVNKEIALPSGRLSVDSALADNKATPTDVLDIINSRSSGTAYGDFSSMSVAESIAGNENSSPDVLTSIFQRVVDNNSIRSYQRGAILASIARNPKTTEETRRAIAEKALEKKDYSLISRLASSPLIPVDLLEAYAREAMWNAANGLASNPASTPDILSKVFNYRKDDVRRYGNVLEEAMSNPNFPMDLLLEIASKPGTRLGKHAKEVLKNRPDRPAPPKRGRKPKAAEPTMTPTEVEAHVHELAEVMHLLKLPASVLLAMEEAADLLSE